MANADEVAEFAALLTELKERTDRSYGALARRLDMNASTLHRYCAGETVPQDFAPVERFATFCGATPSERHELHHRWLQATAARQRVRGAEAPMGATAAPAGSTAAGSSATTEPTATEKLGAAPGAGAPETQAAAPGATAQETPTAASEETATAATSTAADAPATEPAPAAPDATASAGTSTAVGAQATVPVSGAGGASAADTGQPAPPPPRPWYRRRRPTVLVGVGCAVLAVLGTLSALGAGRPSSPPVGAAGPTATVEAPSGTGFQAAPAATPTPSATTPPTPGTASPSPSAGRSSSPAPGVTPSTGAPSVAAVPLTWTADSHAWALGCAHDYVIAKPPEQVPPPPLPQDAAYWARTQDAVHGRETNVEISVQGRSSTAVVLTALRVRVVGRSAPAQGSAYAMDQGCGGSITPRHFAVDLDKDRPLARSVAGADVDTPIPAVRMPYRVSAEEPEVLLVTARTAGCDCSWYLELDWSSEGRTGTVRIDDHGRPFRTSAIEGLPRYVYDTLNRTWRN